MTKAPKKSVPHKEAQTVTHVKVTCANCSNYTAQDDTHGMCDAILPPFVKRLEDPRSYLVPNFAWCSLHKSI